MSVRTRLLLALTVVACVAAALAYLGGRPVTEREALPHDPRALAARIARHPTDWRAASALTEISLDTRLPRRMELWRAARDLAMSMAPAREEPQNSFARSGFFHWNEMTAAERREMLDNFEPQLRRPATFFRMARPFFTLTGDVGMLRRNQPHTLESIELLLSIASVNGRFADYRALRDELASERIADYREHLPSLDPPEIIAALPPPPYHADIEPLLGDALAALQQRPLSDNPNRPVVVDALVDYALRHNLQPLDGLEAITRIQGAADPETRLRLARKLGLNARAAQIEMETVAPRTPSDSNAWQGLCGDEVCTRTWRQMESKQGAIDLTIDPSATDDVPPYVEISVDDARVAEGEVPARRVFPLVVRPGPHRIEIAVANPLTRNNTARRVRVVSATDRAR
jgi:hypothetical protein